MISKTAIIHNSSIGVGTRVWEYTNIYGAKIGDNVTIGSFVEIQSDVTIGNNVIIAKRTCSAFDILCLDVGSIFAVSTKCFYSLSSHLISISVF